MTNLVGTGLNQVPTNADLGTLAFQQAEGVGELVTTDITANSIKINSDLTSANPMVSLNFGAGQNFYGSNVSYYSLYDYGRTSYFDKFGVMQYTDSGNEPRINYDPVTGECKGLLCENAATNYFLYSETPATQDINVGGTQFTLSFYGTGSITVDGHEVVGQGAYPVRTTYTFIPNGSLTYTVSGDVQKVQLENNAWASSYIPTAASPVSRATNFGWITLPNSVEIDGFTLIVEASQYAVNDINNIGNIVTLMGDDISTYLNLSINTSQVAEVLSYQYGGLTVQWSEQSAAPINVNRKYAIASSSAGTFVIDGFGNKRQSTVPMFTNFIPTQLWVGFSPNTTPGENDTINGHIKRIAYYNTRLSNKEIMELLS